MISKRVRLDFIFGLPLFANASVLYKSWFKLSVSFLSWGSHKQFFFRFFTWFLFPSVICRQFSMSYPHAFLGLMFPYSQFFVQLSPDMENQRGTNQHEWFPACFSDLNGFALGTSIPKGFTFSFVALPSVTVHTHPSDSDVPAGRCMAQRTVGVMFFASACSCDSQSSVNLQVTRSPMFPRQWRCCRRRRSRQPRRLWRSSSSRASGTSSSRSNTCSASDRYTKLFCTPRLHLIDQKNTVESVILWLILLVRLNWVNISS